MRQEYQDSERKDSSYLDSWVNCQAWNKVERVQHVGEVMRSLGGLLQVRC